MLQNYFEITFAIVSNYFSSDQQFLSLFSEKNKKANRLHYTPISVAKKAASFLCSSSGNKILDIGSGIGKFCLVGAYFQPSHHFFGIEQRDDLIQQSIHANETLQLKNVYFIHNNIENIDLTSFDHFYFFNSFHEHIDEEKIDYNIVFLKKKYRSYNAYIHKQFSKMPIGTRIASFYTLEEIIPDSYLLVDSHFDESLKFYEKI